MNKIVKIAIIIFLVCFAGFLGYIIYDNLQKNETTIITDDGKDDDIMNNNIVKNDGDFSYNLIRQNHVMTKKNNNYLISPYSIEIALNMLRDGANTDTKLEIDKVIGTRKINNVAISNRISIANGIFIKDKHEKNILSSYKDNLKNNYNAEMIIDKFTTPNKINEWVNKKTNGMIPSILDSIDADFVLGLANALAIDIEWLDKFECNNTLSREFTKIDGTKINVEMMHKNGYQYILKDDVEGIILPYEKYGNIELEFIGLLPNNINNYINNSLEEDINNLDKIIKVPIVSDEKEQIVTLSLPRFTYDSGIDQFKELLQNMGIKRVFSSMADFSNMVTNIPEGVYVSDAIHKTHIELMEKGTKAAAVTYFGIKENSAFIPREREVININFNKPFIYLIREKNSGEILFFGTVYEPNLWKGTTCSKISY